MSPKKNTKTKIVKHTEVVMVADKHVACMGNIFLLEKKENGTLEEFKILIKKDRHSVLYVVIGELHNLISKCEKEMKIKNLLAANNVSVAEKIVKHMAIFHEYL